MKEYFLSGAHGGLLILLDDAIQGHLPGMVLLEYSISITNQENTHRLAYRHLYRGIFLMIDSAAEEFVLCSMGKGLCALETSTLISYCTQIKKKKKLFIVFKSKSSLSCSYQ